MNHKKLSASAMIVTGSSKSASVCLCTVDYYTDLHLERSIDPVDCVVDLSPSDHLEQKKYLRLRNLPANELSDSVLVVKLEFKNTLE